jgi:predicted transcriptional regulator of viral defense system
MRNAYKKNFRGRAFEKKIREIFKQNKVVVGIISSGAKNNVANKFDFYVRDTSGQEYFIEAKARHCHRVDVGQIVEQAAMVMKEQPDAKVMLLCSSIDPAVKDVLAKAGVETYAFPDLAQNAEERTAIRSQLSLSPTEQQAYFALVRNERKVISTDDLAHLLNISRHRAKNLLSALSKHEVIFRFGRGKYAVLPPEVLYERRSYTADPFVIVDAIMQDQKYYVAYSSAAHLHGIGTQIPLTTFVATIQQKRPIDLNRSKIRFITIKEARFFGTTEIEYFGTSVVLSDREKTVLDCVDRSDLVGGVDESTRLLAEAITELDLDRLTDYAKMMKRKALVQRLGFILEKLSRNNYKIPTMVLDRLDRMVDKKRPYRLSPKVRRKGNLSPRWQIYENVDSLRWQYA